MFGRGRDRHGRGYRPRHGARAVPVILLVLGMAACATAESTGGDATTRQGDAEYAAQAGSGSDRNPGPTPRERRASNVPMEKLRAGEKPPQFILFSFDGVGVNPNWDRFLEVAARADARFTALMTGLYFLTDEQSHRYQGPGHRRGRSALAFGGTSDEVREEVRYLNKTWLGGHEMGTHYVGHFCAGAGYHGDQWKTADWNHELNEFFGLMAGWKTNNGLESAPEELLFGPEVVKGGERSASRERSARLCRHGTSMV